ncbi:hypothetical protein Nepgr_005396 [Nepenthes gracilis]|uniref:Uncharacterized protein n=1 Tax=Nepenthes gracilis TaxID=150966 RepID=A0AAD3S3J0_NEPGR|nr:hypothetical protein Nepgr_005396 [Nepenthes gracilis]
MRQQLSEFQDNVASRIEEYKESLEQKLDDKFSQFLAKIKGVLQSKEVEFIVLASNKQAESSPLEPKGNLPSSPGSKFYEGRNLKQTSIVMPITTDVFNSKATGIPIHSDVSLVTPFQFPIPKLQFPNFNGEKPGGSLSLDLKGILPSPPSYKLHEGQNLNRQLYPHTKYLEFQGHGHPYSF